MDSQHLNAFHHQNRENENLQSNPVIFQGLGCVGLICCGYTGKTRVYEDALEVRQLARKTTE